MIETPWKPMDSAPLGEPLECAVSETTRQPARFCILIGRQEARGVVWAKRSGEVLVPCNWMYPGEKERVCGANDPGVRALNEELEQ